MKKEIRLVNKEKGICQVTTQDERFYTREGKDPKTGLPCIEYRPSISWISSSYPKGKYYTDWLLRVGADNADKIMVEAGTRGSKVHQATEVIEKGFEVKLESKFKNTKTDEDEELTAEEYLAVLSFKEWLDSKKPTVLAVESVVFNSTDAGTLDRIYLIDGVVWIVDLKTSQYIWPSHKLQLSRYKHSDIDYKNLGLSKQQWDNRKIAILQLGYKKNKHNYKFTEVDDCHDLYLATYQIWKNENPQAKLKQVDLPLSIKAECR